MIKMGSALAALAGFLAATQVAVQDAKANDYPTIARADYVFACMQVNGRSRQILEKCSCSIDVIAELLPYDKYEEAETIMSVRQKGGEAVAPLMTPEYQEKILAMKRAQVEGELRCF
jgi:lysyl-tRNA synthetase class II